LLDSTLTFAGIGLEAVAVALLVYRRIYRIVPIFSLFLVWAIVSDIAMAAVSHYIAFTDPRYTQIYLVEVSLDSLVQFAVMVELTWSVLRPIRASLPRATIAVIALILVLVGAAVWPIAGWVTLPYPDPQFHTMMRLQEAFSILRVLFVVVLAGFSQLLAIGWRDRELQIATGLGFYSLMSLGGSILHTHHAIPTAYHNVDQVVAFTYLCSLLYWVFSFAQEEAPRQEFAPGMQSFLLAVSGVARADRMSLEQVRKSRKQDK